MLHIINTNMNLADPLLLSKMRYDKWLLRKVKFGAFFHCFFNRKTSIPCKSMIPPSFLLTFRRAPSILHEWHYLSWRVWPLMTLCHCGCSNKQLAGKKHANDLLKKSKSLLKKSNLLNHLLILSKFLLFAFFKQTLEISENGTEIFKFANIWFLKI